MLGLSNNKGFSLMELMTVVTIVAILSLIAVPTYKQYQAQARQKEGMGLLINYYTTAISARGEWGIFPGNFKATGFRPVGTLGYRLRADDNPNNVDITLDDQFCFRTQEACDCATLCPGFKTWQEGPLGGGGAIGPAGVQPNGCGPATTTDTTIRAQVSGWINGSAATPDRIQIDELKQITTCDDGLK